MINQLWCQHLSFVQIEGGMSHWISQFSIATCITSTFKFFFPLPSDSANKTFYWLYYCSGICFQYKTCVSATKGYLYNIPIGVTSSAGTLLNDWNAWHMCEYHDAKMINLNKQTPCRVH